MPVGDILVGHTGRKGGPHRWVVTGLAEKAAAHGHRAGELSRREPGEAGGGGAGVLRDRRAEGWVRDKG